VYLPNAAVSLPNAAVSLPNHTALHLRRS
jgi:hypothetical protein